MTAPTTTSYTPCLGEIVIIDRTLSCVTAVLGQVGTVWWVQTARAQYTALTEVIGNTGRTRAWAGRAYDAG
jgi:hypothetical protein